MVNYAFDTTFEFNWIYNDNGTLNATSLQGENLLPSMTDIPISTTNTSSIGNWLYRSMEETPIKINNQREYQERVFEQIYDLNKKWNVSDVVELT